MEDEWEAEFEQAFDDDDDDAQADGDGAEEHLLLEEPPDDFECDFGITEAASDLPHTGGGSSVPQRKRTRDGQHTAPAPAPPLACVAAFELLCGKEEKEGSERCLACASRHAAPLSKVCTQSQVQALCH